jgi:hypothetical protein
MNRRNLIRNAGLAAVGAMVLPGTQLVAENANASVDLSGINTTVTKSPSHETHLTFLVQTVIYSVQDNMVITYACSSNWKYSDVFYPYHENMSPKRTPFRDMLLKDVTDKLVASRGFANRVGRSAQPEDFSLVNLITPSVDSNYGVSEIQYLPHSSHLRGLKPRNGGEYKFI